MRILMWFSIGFAGSSAICAYLIPGSMIPWMMIPAAMAAAAAVFFGWKHPLLRCFALLVLGAALGMFWMYRFERTYIGNAAAMDNVLRHTAVTVQDYSEETAYGLSALGSVSVEGKQYPCKVYLDDMEGLTPGQQLEGTFLFRTTAPGGSRAASYYQGKGVYLLLYQESSVQLREAEQPDLQAQAAVLRRRILQRLEAAFPADTAPFARALLLGDTSRLNYETDTDFKISGIRHVVAVSGLHVSILFALLSKITFRSKYLMALLGFPVLLLFAALAGFTPSVCRACLMLALTLLAMLSGRSYDGATALSFAVLVMLLVNPMTVLDVGFQLSVASVAGIYCFHGSINGKLKVLLRVPEGKGILPRVLRALCASISTTLSATIFTAPLSAVHFGTVSLIGVVTNLLTMWLITILFYSILAVCLLAGIWSGGAAILGWAASPGIRYVLHIARQMAQAPLAALYTDSIYLGIWMVLVYFLMLYCLFWERKPMQSIGIGIVGLCIALFLSWAEPGLSDVRMTVLDVGQGQCILLQSKGRTFMVDCGGDSDERTADLAAQTLLASGIRELDGLILTHLDRDHAGAVGNFLSRVDTRLLILPPENTELAQYTQGQVIYVSEDIQITYENVVIRIYAPTYGETSNEKSLCVLFDTEKCDILITGDRSDFGERSLLRNAHIPDVDVLVAGHHGSANSTCQELLDAVRPEVVCISAGAGNPYGHPAPKLLRRLKDFGCVVCRTDLQGTILIRR